MKNEFDLELYELVSELNETAGRVVSRIVENVDDAFARITSLLPRMNRKGDVDWNKMKICSELGLSLGQFVLSIPPVSWDTMPQKRSWTLIVLCLNTWAL